MPFTAIRSKKMDFLEISLLETQILINLVSGAVGGKNQAGNGPNGHISS